MTVPIRVAINGAAGNISYALMFRIAAGGMFGPSQPVELRLLDLARARSRLDATVMELHDGCFSLLAGLRATTDPAEAFEGADWIVLLASAPYHPGITRLELLQSNAAIFQSHGRIINDVAKTARVLVVANPCNTNCLIAQSVARDIPPEHFFAMTRLDQNRGRALLADKARVPVDRISRVTAWGAHSPTVYPDFTNAFIDDRPAPEIITDRDWVRQVWEPTVRNRGRQLLEARGGSPAGSAAQAIIATIRSLTCPTPFEHRFSCGVLSDGHYAVPRNLIFSLPLRTEDGVSWSIVHGLYLDEYAQDRIRQNVAELELEASTVSELLGKGR